MTNSYKWSFPALDAYPDVDGETDVVFTVHYVLTGDDGQGHVASVYGTVGVTHDAKAPFTPFADLKETQVTEWTLNALGKETVDAMYANIDGQIEDQINPKSISLTPPWVQTAA